MDAKLRVGHGHSSQPQLRRDSDAFMGSSFPAVFYAFRTHLFPSLRRRSGAPPSSWRRGAASNRWNGAAAADAPLFSSSLSSPPFRASARCALLPALSRWRTAPPLALLPPPPARGQSGAAGGRRQAGRARRDLRNRSGGSSRRAGRASRVRHRLLLLLRLRGSAAAEGGDQGRIDRPPGSTTERERRYLPPFSHPLNTVMANGKF